MMINFFKWKDFGSDPRLTAITAEQAAYKSNQKLVAEGINIYTNEHQAWGACSKSEAEQEGGASALLISVQDYVAPEPEKVECSHNFKMIVSGLPDPLGIIKTNYISNVVFCPRCGKELTSGT